MRLALNHRNSERTSVAPTIHFYFFPGKSREILECNFCGHERIANGTGIMASLALVVLLVSNANVPSTIGVEFGRLFLLSRGRVYPQWSRGCTVKNV